MNSYANQANQIGSLSGYAQEQAKVQAGLQTCTVRQSRLDELWQTLETSCSRLSSVENNLATIADRVLGPGAKQGFGSPPTPEPNSNIEKLMTMAIAIERRISAVSDQVERLDTL